MKDLYEILGVSKDASQDEIKKGFRKKAHQYHPDKQGGDERKFKEINAAYQILGDPEKRKKYDQLGSRYEQYGEDGGFDWQDFASQFGGGFSGTAGGMEFDIDDLADIFGNIFGFGQKFRSGAGARGEDLRVALTVDFMEAVFGTELGKERAIEVYRTVKCDRCKGNGAEPGTKIKDCAACEGKGRRVYMRQTLLGRFQSVSDCPECRATGKVPEVRCSVCKGKGIVRKLDKIDFKIPAGIEQGQILRMNGKGNTGQSGQAGDLLIEINIRPHKEFSRKDDDIYSEVEISYPIAVLGGKIHVNTVDGEGFLTIPPATTQGTEFRLKNKGVPHLQGSGRGDHIVKVKISVPKKVSSKEKQLLRELAESSGQKKDDKGFWSKIF